MNDLLSKLKDNIGKEGVMEYHDGRQGPIIIDAIDEIGNTVTLGQVQDKAPEFGNQTTLPNGKKEIEIKRWMAYFDVPFDDIKDFTPNKS